MLDQIERVLRVAIQVDNDDVEAVLQQLWNIIELRIGGELPCHVGLRPGQGAGDCPSPLLIRTNQGNRHYMNIKHVGTLGRGRHHDISPPWFS